MISALPSSSSIAPAHPVSTARAADGDYKAAGPGHTVKDADGDYKPVAKPAGTTLAAMASLPKGG